MSLLPYISATILALGAVEGLAWWWMHPVPAGLGEPVLVWKRGDRGQETGDGGQRTEDGGQMTDNRDAQIPSENHSSIQNSKFNIQNSSPSPSSIQNSKFNIQNSSPSPSSSSIQHSKFNIQNSPPSLTLLPDLVAKSIPILHCTTGTAARIDRDDGVTIHAAFFEWDATDSASVLEAYKHPPEACMGYIGLQLQEHLPTRAYSVGAETLRFEHTVFREPGGAYVHAFKGIWVSGANKIIGDSAKTLSAQSREIRWLAALKRFRPAYTRVAQGAVRGIPDPDSAWEVFQLLMLKNLRFADS